MRGWSVRGKGCVVVRCPSGRRSWWNSARSPRPNSYDFQEFKYKKSQYILQHIARIVLRFTLDRSWQTSFFSSSFHSMFCTHPPLSRSFFCLLFSNKISGDTPASHRPYVVYSLLLFLPRLCYVIYKTTPLTETNLTRNVQRGRAKDNFK